MKMNFNSDFQVWLNSYGVIDISKIITSVAHSTLAFATILACCKCCLILAFVALYFFVHTCFNLIIESFTRKMLWYQFKVLGFQSDDFGVLEFFVVRIIYFLLSLFLSCFLFLEFFFAFYYLQFSEGKFGVKFKQFSKGITIQHFPFTPPQFDLILINCLIILSLITHVVSSLLQRYEFLD
jgi:hypothetical protein